MLPQAADARTRPRIGRYLITGRIGRGGMGMVYRGLDEALEREVAVKTLNARGDPRRRQPAPLRGGGQGGGAPAAPQHRHRVRARRGPGLPFIAMEMLPGPTSRRSCARGRTIPLAEKLDVVAQVCRGLAYAHERGIVHRDVKPSNVRLLEDGTAKIMDFGIAKLGATHLTKTGMMVGTVHYMSPEQVRGRPLDGRSDVFSVGVILYELLAGERPFRGEGATQVLYKIVNEEPPPPTSRPSATSPRGCRRSCPGPSPRTRMPGTRAPPRSPTTSPPCSRTCRRPRAGARPRRGGARRRPQGRAARPRRGGRRPAARARRRPTPASSRPAARSARRCASRRRGTRRPRPGPRATRSSRPPSRPPPRGTSPAPSSSRPSPSPERPTPGAPAPAATEPAGAGRRGCGAGPGSWGSPPSPPSSCCGGAGRPRRPRCACPSAPSRWALRSSSTGATPASSRTASSSCPPRCRSRWRSPSARPATATRRAPSRLPLPAGEAVSVTLQAAARLVPVRTQPPGAAVTRRRREGRGPDPPGGGPRPGRRAPRRRLARRPRRPGSARGEGRRAGRDRRRAGEAGAGGPRGRLVLLPARRALAGPPPRPRRDLAARVGPRRPAGPDPGVELALPEGRRDRRRCRPGGRPRSRRPPPASSTCAPCPTTARCSWTATFVDYPPILDRPVAAGPPHRRPSAGRTARGPSRRSR